MTDLRDSDLQQLLDAWRVPEPSPAWLGRVARDVKPRPAAWSLPGSLGVALAAGALIGFVMPVVTVGAAAQAADITTLVKWLW